MNRSFTVVAGMWLATAMCAAQVHGVPASVNSPRSGIGVFTPSGVPASVGSLGPQGYSPQFARDLTSTPPRRDRLGRVRLQTPIPLFYEVPYYQVVNVRTPEGQTYVERQLINSEPQKIIVEIHDTRPIAAAPKEEALPKAALRSEVDAPRVATVFIFQDGSRKELKDFAITQTELIDLSEGAIRRTPLTALNRAATLKANLEHGIELYFPSSASD